MPLFPSVNNNNNCKLTKMLARDYDFRRSADNSASKGAMQNFHGAKENWLEFCMFPDLVDPVRMPSLFPVPTHIVKRQQVQTIIPTTGNLYAIWKPFTIDNGTEATVQDGYRSMFAFTPTESTSNDDDNAGTNVQSNHTRYYTPPLSNVAGLVHGGARMIGAFLEIEYIGTADQHAGIIEVGLHMHSANSGVDLVRAHTYSQSEIIQAPFYRKFKPADGCRVVWFPVDEEAFNFQDFDTRASGIGEADPATGPDDPVSRLKQITLRTPVHPEWCINFSGLSLNQSLRVHLCSYYEVVPEESYRDIYMARKASSQVNVSSLKTAISNTVQAEMVATPAKSSLGFGSFRDKAKMFIDGISTAYSLYKDPVSVFSSMMTTG